MSDWIEKEYDLMIIKLILFIITLFISVSLFSQKGKQIDDVQIYQTILKYDKWKHHDYFIFQKETASEYFKEIKGVKIFHDTLYMYEIYPLTQQNRIDTFWRRLQVDTSWKDVVLKINVIDSNEIDLPKLKNYNITYINKISLDSIFTTEIAGWTDLGKTFPKAKGLYVFSKVVYSDDHKKAIAFFSGSQGYKSGSGYIYFLTNDNGLWKVSYKEMMWVS